MRQALAIPAFRSLLAAYGTSQLGDWAAEVALAVLIYGQSHSATAVAAAWLAHRCLLALAAPLLVTHAERRSPTRISPAIALGEAALFAALAAFGARGGLVVILPLVAVDGLIAPVNRALIRAHLANATKPHGLLSEGNAAINVVFTANAMLAAALGGILTAAFGAQATLAFDAATFVAVAAFLRRAPLTQPEHEQAQAGARQRVTDAIRYVRATRPLGALLAADFAFTAFALLITPLEVVLVQGPLHAGGAALGFVLGGWGVGMIAGGAVSARATRHLGQHGVLAAGAAAQGIAFAGMGLAASVGQAVACSAIGGIGNGLSAVLLITVIQQHTADHLQARVSSLMETLVTTATAIAFTASGALAALAGVRAVYEIAGAGCLAVVALAAAALATPPAPAGGRARSITATT